MIENREALKGEPAKATKQSNAPVTPATINTSSWKGFHKQKAHHATLGSTDVPAAGEP